MKKSFLQNRYLQKYLSGGITLFALGYLSYFAHRLPGHWQTLFTQLMVRMQLRSWVVGAVALIGSHCLQTISWHSWLAAFGVHVGRRSKQLWESQANSVMLRYVAGYWGGLGYRHIKLRNHNIGTHSGILGASSTETLIQMSLMTLLALPAARLVVGVPLGEPSHLGMILLSLLIVCGILWRRFHKVPFVLSWASFATLGTIAAYALQVVLFLSLLPPSYPTWVAVTAFSAGMLAGQVAPGVPQGLGVREGAIIAILAPYGSIEEITVITLSYRFFTVVADLGFWLFNQIPLRLGSVATSLSTANS